MPPSDREFLGAVYSISGGKFREIESFETMPFARFLLLCEVHMDAIDRQKAEIEKARRR